MTRRYGKPAIRLHRVIRNNKRPTIYCQHLRCGRFTSGGKQFCSAHIFEMPYVKALLRRKMSDA